MELRVKIDVGALVVVRKPRRAVGHSVLIQFLLAEFSGRLGKKSVNLELL